MNDVHMQEVQRKLQYEISILEGLIMRYQSQEDLTSIGSLVAYRYGLEALREVYAVTEQKEVMPF
ncbi:hypothetical protein Q4580_18265 [Bacillus thuringiensis]|nr:hypothetical protein [Bacillus thuringiensis]MDO6661381.1 hypothetical protein [Bacillus thuringiensis]MDO6701928.1 hypothetical protein [Bacillus thuringiensis]